MLAISKAIAILARREGVRIDSGVLSDADSQGQFDRLEDVISFYKDYGLAIRTHRIDGKFARNTKTVPSAVLLDDGQVLCILSVAEPSPEGLIVSVINPNNPSVLEKIPVEEIQAKANGKAITLAPVRGKDDVQYFDLSELYKLFAQKPMATSILWLLSFSITFLGLAPIIYLQTALDKVIGYGATSTFGVLTVCTVLALFAALLLGRQRDEILDCFGTDIDNKLSAAISERVIIAARQRRLSKEVVLTAQNAVDRLRSLLINKASRSVFDLSAVLLLTPVLFFYNPIIATLVVIYCLICLALNIATTKKSSTSRQELSDTVRERTSSATQIIGAKNDLLSFDMDVRQKRTWQRRMVRSCLSRTKVSEVDSAMNRRTAFYQSGLTVLIIFSGVELVLAGHFTPGSLIAINLLGAKILQPLLKIGGLYADLPQIKELETQVNAVLALPRGGKASGLRPAMTGQVSMHDVEIEGADGTKLEHISLELDPASRVVFLSTDNNNASTLVQAIDLTTPHKSGRILFDETEIRRIDTRHLARRVIHVNPQPFFFEGTIADNLHGINSDIDPRDIDTIAASLGFSDSIEKMEDGHDTKIDTSGAPLCYTARIQLALARALVVAPSVLVIDRALDMIPTNVAKRIVKGIESRIGGGSVIVATVRPDIAVIFDEIYQITETSIKKTTPPANRPPSQTAAEA